MNPLVEEEIERVDVTLRALKYARLSGYFSRKILDQVILEGEELLEYLQGEEDEISSY